MKWFWLVLSYNYENVSVLENVLTTTTATTTPGSTNAIEATTKSTVHTTDAESTTTKSPGVSTTTGEPMVCLQYLTGLNLDNSSSILQHQKASRLRCVVVNVVA